jgi:hypothetical protein
MIIRIATEGQYRIDSSYLDRLNDIDDEIMSAVASGDRERFATLFANLLDTVRSNGKSLDPDELHESHVVLPPPDTTFDEAVHLFVGDGVIPPTR